MTDQEIDAIREQYATCDPTYGRWHTDERKLRAFARAILSRAIPEGHVVVPKEPTDAMQAAGPGAIRWDTTILNKMWTANAVYRAMIAAAPQPPAPSPAVAQPGAVTDYGTKEAAVAQPVADENELWDLLGAVDEAVDRKAVPHAWVSYARTAGHDFIMKRRAALCQPAEEGGKA